MGNICRSHKACGHESCIAIAPTLNIYEVLCSGEQCALTELIRRGCMVQFMLQPTQEVLHNPDGDAGLPGRVDKAKENEVMQEHPPVRSKAFEQPRPVQLRATGMQ